MLQCYCVINAKIFRFLVAITRHPCVVKRKRCRWQRVLPWYPGVGALPRCGSLGTRVCRRLVPASVEDLAPLRETRENRRRQSAVGRAAESTSRLKMDLKIIAGKRWAKNFSWKKGEATYSNQDKGTADIKTHLCLYKWRKKEKIFLKRQQNLLWNSVREGWGRGWRLEVAELSFEEWGCDQPSFYLCKCKCKRERELSTERWAMELPPSIFTSPWLFISTKYFFIYLLCPLKKILWISVSLSKHTTNGPQISF